MIPRPGSWLKPVSSLDVARSGCLLWSGEFQPKLAAVAGTTVAQHCTWAARTAAGLWEVGGV